MPVEMTELLTSAQMRAIEQAAIASGEVSGLSLMELAGLGVVDAIFAHWPALAPKTLAKAGALPRAPGYLGQDKGGGLEEGGPLATILCGPGNNGGDGYVIARLLFGHGWRVRVLAAAGVDRMPPDAAENQRRWLEIGAVEAMTEANLRSGPESDIYVDAIFGTGLTRPPEGEILAILRHIGGANGDLGYYQPRLVAVDAPSGLCLDSGRSLISGWAVPRAALTVTFERPKLGHHLAQGPAMCGALRVVDLGLEPWREMTAPKKCDAGWRGIRRQVTCGLVAPIDDDNTKDHFHPGRFSVQSFDKGARSGRTDDHKFSHGHALVLGGGMGYGGAGRLTARGALRVGAGLVSLACPEAAMAENAARLDAVMVRPLGDDKDLAGLLGDGRISALCVGPGFGLEERERALVAAVLSARRKAVLDADALTLVSRDAVLFGALHKDVVLTPHGGEFARLFPDLAATLAEPAAKGPAYSKVDATRDAARRAGCVVLYKGADTVIADPLGRCGVHSAQYERVAPWLATAGSGDVLAGFIAGLMARGFSPFEAACMGAWLHTEAARSFGPGLIAEDLPEELPRVFRAILRKT